MKKITEEQIENIKNLINERKILDVKKILGSLEDSKEEEILEELKRISRDKGRTNMIPKSEIEQILVKYGEKK